MTTVVAMHCVKNVILSQSLTLCMSTVLYDQTRRACMRRMPGLNSDSCCGHHKIKRFQVRAVVDLHDVKTSGHFVTLPYVWV